MTLIAYVYPKLKTAKHVVRQMYKNPRFGTPFNSQHVKESQRLMKSAWQHFYRSFPLLLRQLTWQICLLVICEVRGGFINTLIADEKYSLGNSEVLPEPIQMQLSKKQINFFEIFATFMESKAVFKCFKKR